VKKHVLAAPDVNKPETPVGLPLDRAFCHFLIDSKNVDDALPDTTGSGFYAAPRKS
jgi:hypothetical protein